MADDDKEWEDVPAKKGGGVATAKADDEWEDVSPNKAATAPATETAAPEEKEPTFLEKARKGANLTGSEGKLGLWDVVKHGLNPMSIPGDVSETLGNVSDWARKKSEEKQTEALGEVAKGGTPSSVPASGYDLLGRVANVGSGLTEPKNVALGAATIVAPEVMGPALIAHGGYNAVKAGQDVAEHGLNPENAEQGLGSLSEMAGGGAALGEVPARGGLKNTLTGKVADKVVRGTPLTEEGKIAAAKEQALTVKKPSMTETEYAGKVDAAMPDLQKIAQDNKGQIKTPRQAVQAINNRISQIEAPIGEHLKNLGSSEVVHPDEYQAQINAAVEQELAKKPGSYKPAEIEKAKKTVMDFLGDQPKPLEELEGNRRRLNQDAEAYYNTDTAGKRSIDVSDATAVAQRAAANKIRDILYGDEANPGKLENAGVSAVDANGQQVPLRELRKQVGRLIDVRDHFEDAITRAEAAGDWKAFDKWKSGPSIAAGGLGLAAGTAAGGPIGAVLGLLGGEGIKAWADYLRSKNPNLNVQKMFRNLEQTSAPNTATVQTRPPIRQYEQPVAPQMAQHLEPIGPQLPSKGPGEFQLNDITPPGARTGMWQPQVGGPPDLTWGGPTSPYREPIGPKFQEEPGLGPIHGPQSELDLPKPPESAPLFSVQQTPRVGGTPPTSVNEALPPIGGPGREGTLGKIGETKKAEPTKVPTIRLPHPEPVDLKPGEATSDRFFDKETEEWNPERAANHEAVAEAAVKGKTAPTDRAPDAIITMGGTSSGKTTLTRQVLGADKNLVNVDSDTNKLHVPEYDGLKQSDLDNAAARVHEESKAISKLTIQKAVAKGLDFMYDTSTGGGGERLFKKLKDLGYKVRIIYADVPVEEAIKRAEERAQSSEDPTNRGRWIPEDVIRQKHVEAAKAFDAVRNSPNVEEVRAFDTTSRSPEEFYNRSGQKETVHNQKTLDRVKEKANAEQTPAAKK